MKTRQVPTLKPTMLCLPSAQSKREHPNLVKIWKLTQKPYETLFPWRSLRLGGYCILKNPQVAQC